MKRNRRKRRNADFLGRPIKLAPANHYHVDSPNGTGFDRCPGQWHTTRESAEATVARFGGRVSGPCSDNHLFFKAPHWVAS